MALVEVRCPDDPDRELVPAAPAAAEPDDRPLEPARGSRRDDPAEPAELDDPPDLPLDPLVPDDGRPEEPERDPDPERAGAGCRGRAT
ncbi:MAG: hypothetical protein LBM23_04825 [Propionibacteriaceae bacterium]|nr:hypothetical protein [Propionibacteriaceae bacterium]